MCLNFINTWAGIPMPLPSQRGGGGEGSKSHKTMTIRGNKRPERTFLVTKTIKGTENNKSYQYHCSFLPKEEGGEVTRDIK